MTVVRHLELAVLPLRGAKQPGLDAGAGADLPLLHERRPEAGAGAVAGALTVLVLHEEVQRPTRARCQHLSDFRLVQRDAASRRAARGGALMCDGRGGGNAGRSEGNPQNNSYDGSFRHLSPPTGVMPISTLAAAPRISLGLDCADDLACCHGIAGLDREAP